MRNQQHRGNARGGGHDEERLQQLMARMRTALQLGMRSSSVCRRKDGELKWANTDAQLQGQAVRAISAFVAAIPPRRVAVTTRSCHVVQTYIEEAVAALEYLLAVDQEAIYKQAAAASAALGKATSGRYMLRLLSPLSRLLSPTKASDAATSAATAIQSILLTVRPQQHHQHHQQQDEDEDPVWNALQSSLNHLLWRIGMAECTEVLAMVLERYPGARFRVAKPDAVRASLLACLLQSSSNEAVAVATLRACQALVLCAGVGALFLQDGEALWKTLAHCLHQCKPLLVNREALRLLSLLGRLSPFATAFTGPNTHAILEGCLRNVNEGNRARLTVVEQGVVLEAAHATSVILRWAGAHHGAVLALGIFKFVFLQLTVGEKSSATNATIWKGPAEKVVDVEWKSSRGAGKVTSSLRSLLWEIVGYLAAHFNSGTTKEMLSGRPPGGPGISGITVFACATLLRALHRSGHTTSDDPTTTVSALGMGSGEQHISAQELLQICKTMFLLLSSPCHEVSNPTKACMATAIKFQDQAWLPRLVESLAIGHTGPSLVKPDSTQTATNLFALACFSYFPECRELLLQEKTTLEVLSAILKLYGNRALQKETQHSLSKWSVVHQRAGIAAKTCCEEIVEDWEGSDTVLFASLCAFTKLMQGSERAQAVARSLRRGRLTEEACAEGAHGGTVSLLWALAESAAVASGVRWWAATALSCFNIFGFPSRLGRHICQIFDDALFPDVVFVLKDGSRVLAHGVVLAIKCSSILQRKREGHPEIHLSKRISSNSFKALLEYIYSGVVHLDAEDVDEMKALSKGCGLESFTNLLHGKAPVWGLLPAACNLAPALAPALGYGGYTFSDVILRGRSQGGELGEGLSCRSQGCDEAAPHVHAHRAILSGRCDYYRGLFCSGMRESTAESINVDIYRLALETLVLYWYSGTLTRLCESWCAWNNLEKGTQILYLQNVIKLAQFAGQLLMLELQEECNHLVLQHIKEGCNVGLGPDVITHAAKCTQGDLVHMCVNALAPAYPQLRDGGALEGLDEEFTDLLRVAHIQFALSDSA